MLLKYGTALSQLLSTDYLDTRAAPIRMAVAAKDRKTRRSRSERLRSAPVFEHSEIVKVFEEPAGSRMLLLGSAGSGKTVILTSLAVEILRRTRASDRAFGPIPCILSLSSWDSLNVSMEDWLRGEIANVFQVTEHVANALIHDGLVMPILDGLDEMDAPKTTSTLKADAAVVELNQFLARRPDQQLAISCRSGRRHYERISRDLRGVASVHLLELTGKDVADYFEQYVSRHDTASWKPMLEALRSNETGLVAKALATPWRASAALSYVLTGGNPNDLLPTSEEIKRSSGSYFRRVGEELVTAFIKARLRASEGGRHTDARFKQLQSVARLSFADEGGGTSHRESEIVLHTWWRKIPRGRATKYQMWFTYVLMHVPIGVLGFLPNPSRPERALTMIALLVNYLTVQLVAYQMVATRKGPIRLDLASVAKRPVALAVSIILSVGTGLSGLLMYGAPYGIPYGVVSLVTAILFIAAASPDAATAASPSTALSNDRRFAILIGLAVAAYTYFYYVAIYATGIAVVFASMGGLACVCASSYARYSAAAYAGWVREGLPIRLRRFLQIHHEAGLLRVAGIGYEFRHREIAEHLLDSAVEIRDESKRAESSDPRPVALGSERR
ncbi:NACHT domain-containing protein [Pseudonocardia halophobica]|uniref:NACHT domain-containing protein n=1 Tax=Pseudonocardia halophobica TaxID=29401 RepID=UPI003D8DCEAC